MAEKVGLDARLSGVAKYLANAKAVTAANVQLGTSMTTTAAASKGMLAGFIGTAPLIAGAAVAGIGALSLKMASDFETAFTEVTTLFEASEDQVQSLRKDLLDLSASMGVDAKEAAQALYQAISAGVPPENAIAFLQENTKLAIGGVTDLTTAVDLTTTVLNAWGLTTASLTRVNDTMFTAVRLGKTTISELGASFFQVASIAASANIPIEDIGAAFATLTANGVPTAEAATRLKAAIQALVAPTKRQTARAEALGIALGEDVLAAKGFAAAMEDLVFQAGGSQEVLRRLLGSSEALQAVLILGGTGAQFFNRALDDMDNKAGAADASFQKMNKTFARQSAILKESTKRLLIDLGTRLLPLLQAFVEVLLVVAGQFGSLSRSTLRARIEMLEMVKDGAELARVLAGIGAVAAALFGRPFLAGGAAIGFLALGDAIDFLDKRIGQAKESLASGTAGIETIGDASVESAEEAFNLQEALAEAGAVAPDMADGLADLGTAVEDKLTAPILKARQTVEDLHSELERLLGMPTLESAREGLALARLRLAQLDAEKRADKERETREKQVESLEDLIDAREEEREALEEEFASTTGVNAARRNQIQRRLAQLDKEQLAAAVQIKHLEEAKSAAEREAEAIESQIGKLEELTTRRDLEREALRQRGILSDATVLKDNEVIRAAERMIVVIGDVTGEIREQYGDIRSQWIPALDDAAGAMDGVGGSAGGLDFELGLLDESLEDVDEEIRERLINRMKAFGVRMLIEAVKVAALIRNIRELNESLKNTAEATQNFEPIEADLFPGSIPLFPPPESRHSGGFTPEGQKRLALLHGPEVTVPLRSTPNQQVASILRNLIPLPFNGQATQTSSPSTGGGFQNFGTMRIEKGSDTDDAVSTLVGALR